MGGHCVAGSRRRAELLWGLGSCRLEDGERRRIQGRVRWQLTFREKTSAAICHVAAEEPSIAKVIVSFNQFNAIAFGQTQLIGAARDKVVWMVGIISVWSCSGLSMGGMLQMPSRGSVIGRVTGDLRTTSRREPAGTFCASAVCLNAIGVEAVEDRRL